MKEKAFIRKKVTSRQYSTETITDTGFAADVALHKNTPTQAESLLRSLEQAAKYMHLYMKTDKITFMCLNQVVAIFSRNDKPLKLLDYFRYLSSKISSTERYINISMDFY